MASIVIHNHSCFEAVDLHTSLRSEKNSVLENTPNLGKGARQLGH